jgi:hypothetical protein
VLHHLGTPSTRLIRQNVGQAFHHALSLLNEDGFILVFESTCSNFLAWAHDLLRLPIQFALKYLLRFASVRMLALDEIKKLARNLNCDFLSLPFRKPSHIAVVWFTLPGWAYPVEIICAKLSRSAGMSQRQNRRCA